MKLKNMLTDFKKDFFSLKYIQLESDAISRIATALVRTQTRAEMIDLIVNESRKILAADATCLFLMQSDGNYEMVGEYGCTDEFKTQWQRVAPERLPLSKQKDPHESLFFGSAEQLKAAIPETKELVDRSRRETIAYAPLVINQKPIGILGFSYNTAPSHPPRKNFILTLVNLYAQALDRVLLSEQERRVRQEAEDANKAKTQFLANISHEIRTPIGVIQGFTDLVLRSGTLNAEQQRWIKVIRQNAMHLSSIIGDVLDISKIEADKIEVNRCFFSLSALLDDVKAITTFKAEEKGIELWMSCNTPNAQIYSDPTHLRQILVNVIGNAIKFTPEGGVKITVECEDSRFLAFVDDTGIGIAPGDHRRIFDAFTQAENPMSKKFGGTGLGLSISKRLLNLLGGDIILLRSSPKEGSSFLIEVPCEIYFSDKPQKNDERTRQGAKNLKGLRILLAEDSIDNQDLFTNMLEQEGAEVDVAENGLRAIEYAMNHEYDVVLMDIQMPELDGLSAASELRSKGYRKPIVALTAHALTSEKDNASFKGFDDYITKPVSGSMLIQTVRRLGHNHLHH